MLERCDVVVNRVHKETRGRVFRLTSTLDWGREASVWNLLPWSDRVGTNVVEPELTGAVEYVQNRVHDERTKQNPRRF